MLTNYEPQRKNAYLKQCFQKIQPWGAETSEERKRWASVSQTPRHRCTTAGGQSLRWRPVFFLHRWLESWGQLCRQAELRSSSIKIKWSPASVAGRGSFETLMRAVSAAWQPVRLKFIKYLSSSYFYSLKEPEVESRLRLLAVSRLGGHGWWQRKASYQQLGERFC